MKFNQWTVGLAASGLISLASVTQAEEAASQVLTALSSTTLSGYVDTSAIWKLGTGAQTLGRSFDQTSTSKMDGFNLNVVKLTLEKPLDEGAWSAGYKLDLLFGPDAALFNPSPISTGGIGGVPTIPSLGDAAIKQAYAALRAPVGNGLDIKMGVFDTIIGYEVFESGNNPNYSRSYGFRIEPTQHTGILASYHVTDWMSMAGGIANTYNAGINFRPVRATGAFPASKPASESEKTYMGSVTLTAPESLGVLKGAALYAGVIDGLSGLSAGSGSTPTAGDTTSLYVGTTIPTPIEGLGVGAAYDYRATKVPDPFKGVGGHASNYANAVSLYASYTLDKWKFNNRIEFASGSQGTFGASTLGLSSTAGHPTIGKPPGTQEELFSETLTVDYSLWANVLSRVEFRWDHDLKARNGGAAPFGIDDKNALTLALNVIYKF